MDYMDSFRALKARLLMDRFGLSMGYRFRVLRMYNYRVYDVAEMERHKAKYE